MTQTPSSVQWEIEEGPKQRQIRLRGHWNLLADATSYGRVVRELATLDKPHELLWDLEGIETLDSAGALALWRTWGERLPADLRCPEDHRSWFDRLAELPDSPAPQARYTLMRAVDALGARILAILTDVGGVFLLAGRIMVALLYALAHPRLIPWKEISANIYRTGAQSVPLLGFIGFLVGFVMTYQIAIDIGRFGANLMVVNLSGVAMLRELGAVMTAIILTGRSASAMTAGIGAMRLTEELDALQVLGVSSTLRLVVPRVLGMAVAVMLLVVWVDFVGLAGSVIVAQEHLSIPPALFLQRLPNAVPWINFWIGLGKGAIYGVLIALIACYFGLKVRANTESLSHQTTASVVTSLTLILLLDASSGVLLAGIGMY